MVVDFKTDAELGARPKKIYRRQVALYADALVRDYREAGSGDDSSRLADSPRAAASSSARSKRSITS